MKIFPFKFQHNKTSAKGKHSSNNEAIEYITAYAIVDLDNDKNEMEPESTTNNNDEVLINNDDDDGENKYNLADGGNACSINDNNNGENNNNDNILVGTKC